MEASVKINGKEVENLFFKALILVAQSRILQAVGYTYLVAAVFAILFLGVKMSTMGALGMFLALLASCAPADDQLSAVIGIFLKIDNVTLETRVRIET